MACLLHGHRPEWRCRFALDKRSSRVIDLCCCGCGAGKDIWGSNSWKRFDSWCPGQASPVAVVGRRETGLVKIKWLTVTVSWW